MVEDDNYGWAEGEKKRIYIGMYSAVSFASPKKLSEFPEPGKETEEDFYRLNKAYGLIISEEMQNALSQIKKERKFKTAGWVATGIVLTGIGLFGAWDALQKTTAPPHCYHHTIQPGENLENALQHFRTIDPNVSDNEVIAQNNMPLDLRVHPGQDITYCFQK